MALNKVQWQQEDLRRITGQFDIAGKFVSAHPFGNGHIHDTFLVTFRENTEPRILQRINHQVFRHVPEMMRNIALITGHIRSRLQAQGVNDINRRCLTLIKTRQGKTYYKDNQGNFWRCFHFIKDSRSFNSVDSVDVAFAAGLGYGRFHALISDLDQTELFETIPAFHDIDSRMKLFNNAVSADSTGRVDEVSEEIGIVRRHSVEMRMILELGASGRIPVRVTHNDTKINNVLFDSRNQPLCVIDLDTVMPGYIHYDFGDAIRTAANTAAEDEADLGKVSMNINLFRAFTEGFLQECSAMLTEDEIHSLAFSPKLLAFIMGLRFLTDYIEGDIYYKIHFDTHNLQRARAQFKLLESMDEQTKMMEQIVSELAVR